MSIEKELKNIIKQGNQHLYQKLINDIVSLHRQEYTEENLPTSEGFILELVNNALDDMWAKENCKRNMDVYGSFLTKKMFLDTIHKHVHISDNQSIKEKTVEEQVMINREAAEKFWHPCPRILYPKFPLNLIIPDIPSVAKVISREEIRDAIREGIDQETEKFNENIEKGSNNDTIS